jgi:hypothetical protein
LYVVQPAALEVIIVDLTQRVVIRLVESVMVSMSEDLADVTVLINQAAAAEVPLDIVDLADVAAIKYHLRLIAEQTAPEAAAAGAVWFLLLIDLQ